MIILLQLTSAQLTMLFGLNKDVIKLCKKLREKKREIKREIIPIDKNFLVFPFIFSRKHKKKHKNLLCLPFFIV